LFRSYTKQDSLMYEEQQREFQAERNHVALLTIQTGISYWIFKHFAKKQDARLPRTFWRRTQLENVNTTEFNDGMVHELHLLQPRELRMRGQELGIQGEHLFSSREALINEIISVSKGNVYKAGHTKVSFFIAARGAVALRLASLKVLMECVLKNDPIVAHG